MNPARIGRSRETRKEEQSNGEEESNGEEAIGMFRVSLFHTPTRPSARVYNGFLTRPKPKAQTSSTGLTPKQRIQRRPRANFQA